MSLLLFSSSLNFPTPLQKSKFPPPASNSGKKRVSYTSCEQKQSKEGIESQVIDRRNVLLGLGGLYGATTTLGLTMPASGTPVGPPDLKNCHLATDYEKCERVECCPFKEDPKIIDFVPPSIKEPFRVRRAAHKLDDEYIAKFKEGISIMKSLGDDDPLSFNQQAKIHCTFCNDAFDQVGYRWVPLQVHASFLFLPWHRYYLYFFERIIGKLIDDPTFALPFWNWDTPKGMRMPKIYYTDKTSPLYDDLRNHDHYNALLDLTYNRDKYNPKVDSCKVRDNLNIIRTAFKENHNFPRGFMGVPVCAGVVPKNKSYGALESIHNTIHNWVGHAEKPYQDMGNFVTAARDMLFYAHHANCDRLWDIFSDFRGYKPEFNDPDYLDASFIFYNENRQVVKCKVRDCLTPRQLGYSYCPEILPWLRRRKPCPMAKKDIIYKKQLGEEEFFEFGTDPKELKEAIKAIVLRPKTSRSKAEKEEEVEILVIEDIQVPHGEGARFDVYITKLPFEGDKGELAGSFVHISHGSSTGSHSAKLELGLTSLLEDIEAEASDKLVVTLVPGEGNVAIGGLSIELFKVDDD